MVTIFIQIIDYAVRFSVRSIDSSNVEVFNEIFSTSILILKSFYINVLHIP